MSRSLTCPPLVSLALAGLAACGAPEPGAERLQSSGPPAIDAGLALGEELSLASERIDRLGLTHRRYQQLVGGVPVWGGERLVHLDRRGGLRGMTDHRLLDVVAQRAPSLSAEEATRLALVGEVALEAEPDLWIFRASDGDHLVWRVRGRTTAGALSLPVVFVDAQSGDEVFRYDNLQTAEATGQGHYTDGAVSFGASEQEDGTFALADAELGVETHDAGARVVVFPVASAITSSTADFGESALSGVDAHWGLSQARSFYEERFGLDSFDGAGAPIEALVNYDRDYVNAFWDGRNLAFGEGDGVWSDPLTTLDIAGHELSHAVTQYSANLQYYGESGGLNEATSDIMGAAIEAAVYGQTEGTWLMGEDCWTPETEGDALRWMSDPNADGESLDYYSARAASVDVHYSSGIANLAFVLASDGGTHPRGMSDVEVTGMGIEGAAEVWYTALTGYMGASTTFGGARDATLYAAEDLYGADSAEVQTWSDAWDAVGVTHGACATGGFSVLLAEGETASGEPDMKFSTWTGGDRQLIATLPEGGVYTVELYRNMGRDRWVKAAEAEVTGPLDSLELRVQPRGQYRWAVRADSGAGRFSACLREE